MVVKYQIGTGIKLNGNQLTVYSGSQPLTSVKFDGSEEDLADEFENFSLVRRFPDQEFSLTGEKLMLNITLELDLITGEFSFGGDLRINENLPGYWEAIRCRNGAVIDQAYRPWFDEKDPQSGWKYLLPSELIDSYDPVIVRRVALFIDRSIYARAQGNVSSPSLRGEITNIFSAGKPIWPESIPQIGRF